MSVAKLLILSFSIMFGMMSFLIGGEQHFDLLQKANESVSAAAAKAATDPLRPIFHLQTRANWINDPNGPLNFNGEYHMFFQHNPYGEKWGNMSWGHAVSDDMVHWRHLPIVLTPEPDSYDKDGVFSGCAVNDDGVLTIIYTGVHPEVQCIARSYDNGRTFTKFEGNPVIAASPIENTTGFRDPFVWRDGDWWYCVIGSGINGEGGTAFLYRSKNLEQWDYLNPIAAGFGTMWECPNFFPVGDKWALVVSPYGECKYSIGDFKKHIFHPGEWRRMDFGGRGGFYAPNCLVDEKGRRIMWGWITGGGTNGAPWNGMLTLPRVITLGEDNRLHQSPLPELKALRKEHQSFENLVLDKDMDFVLPDFAGNAFEMMVEFDISGVRKVGIDVLRTPDGKENQRISFDNQNLVLSSGDKSGEFQLTPNEDVLLLHIFVDRSVIEVFANNRECLTHRVYPERADARGISLFSEGRPATVKKIDLWKMDSIWKE